MDISQKTPTPRSTRRGFLETSGRVAAGAAVALPIVLGRPRSGRRHGPR